MVTEIDLSLDEGNPENGLVGRDRFPVRIEVTGNGAALEDCGELLSLEDEPIEVGKIVKLRSCFADSSNDPEATADLVGHLEQTGSPGEPDGRAWFSLTDPVIGSEIPDLETIYTGSEPAPYDLADLYYNRSKSPFAPE